MPPARALRHRMALRLIPESLRPLVFRTRSRLLRQNTRKKVFTDIYLRGRWRGSRPTLSGPGSDLEQTARLRSELPKLLEEIRADSFMDAPCGDLFWMRELRLPVTRYIGVDIVSEMISRNRREFGDEVRSFMVADLVSDELPRVDVILCRDCLVHLTFTDALRVLTNFKRSGSTYLLTTTFTGRERNDDTDRVGGWRPLNLVKPPFGFPEPVRILEEGCTEMDGAFADKALSLWRLADLDV